MGSFKNKEYYSTYFSGFKEVAYVNASLDEENIRGIAPESAKNAKWYSIFLKLPLFS